MFVTFVSHLDVFHYADSLRIAFDSVVGRHGRAARDIRFGDVIFVDTPIGSMRSRESTPGSGGRCFHCFGKQAETGPFPSPFDGGKTKFCRYARLF